MKNEDLANKFDQIANMLDLKGELPFKVNAYRKAARVISDLQDDIATYWEAKKLDELPGIGNAFVKKIDEYFSTGKISKFETLKLQHPSRQYSCIYTKSGQKISEGASFP